MYMDLPQEIEVWYLIPAIRREFALLLKEKYGLKQKQIASILGVTEAAISQYKHAKRAKGIDFNEPFKNELDSSVKRIVDDPSSMIYEVQRICDIAKESRLLCEIHTIFDDDVPVKCSLCFGGEAHARLPN